MIFYLKRPIILSVVFLLLPKTSLAVELRAEAIEEFNKFIASVEMRLESRFSGRNFLWSDEFPAVRQQLLKGMVIAQPAQGNGTVPLKGALIQDWTGAVFLPRATLRDVLSIVQDYDHHSDFYKPDIAAAKIESHQDNEFLVYMRIVKAKLMLSDVLDTGQAIQFIRLDPKRIYSRAYSKRISEVAARGSRVNISCPLATTEVFCGVCTVTGSSKSATAGYTSPVNRSRSLATFHSEWQRC